MEIGAVLGAAAILGGIGIVFATLIAVAHRAFWVWEDPRLDEVATMLPGTNCGACGEPGCRAFAEALVEGRLQPAACTSMGEAEVEAVADYLGVEAGEANHQVARLLCAGAHTWRPNRRSTAVFPHARPPRWWRRAERGVPGDASAWTTVRWRAPSTPS